MARAIPLYRSCPFINGQNRSVDFSPILLLLCMSFVQQVHLNYFGTLLETHEFGMISNNSYEIYESLKGNLSILKTPALLFFLSIVLLKLAYKTPKPHHRHFKYGWMLIVGAFLSFPIRAYYEEWDTGKIASTSRLNYANFLWSMNYYLSNTLMRNNSQKIVDIKIPNFKSSLSKPVKENIIIIMGESLRDQNLSLNGYARKTTPYLEKYTQSHNVIFKRAISGGIATGTSLPLFFNAWSGHNSEEVFLKQNRCLFKLAKEQGYKTIFISTHGAKSIRYILNSLCPQYIDEVTVSDNSFMGSENVSSFYDDYLLEKIEEKNLFQKNTKTPLFLVLHMRGSHSPYNSRYPKEFDTFHEKETNDDHPQNLVNQYDNSILYSDKIIFEILRKIERSKISASVFFTSDHGENLGEDNIWGHTKITPWTYSVPFFFTSFNSQNAWMNNFIKKHTEPFLHIEISQAIAQLLGYTDSANAEKCPYTVIGGIFGADSAEIPLHCKK